MFHAFVTLATREIRPPRLECGSCRPAVNSTILCLQQHSCMAIPVCRELLWPSEIQGTLLLGIASVLFPTFYQIVTKLVEFRKWAKVADRKEQPGIGIAKGMEFLMNSKFDQVFHVVDWTIYPVHNVSRGAPEFHSFEIRQFDIQKSGRQATERSNHQCVCDS